MADHKVRHRHRSPFRRADRQPRAQKAQLRQEIEKRHQMLREQSLQARNGQEREPRDHNSSEAIHHEVAFLLEALNSICS